MRTMALQWLMRAFRDEQLQDRIASEAGLSERDQRVKDVRNAKRRRELDSKQAAEAIEVRRQGSKQKQTGCRREYREEREHAPPKQVRLSAEAREELSYDEMAEMTGVSVPALKMRVKRACDGLRDLLEGVYHG